ncbi:(deoxy)nucleoside triphosphate pyrophosphohydrolase [Lactiplantibacillus xiangfangensis]|uniref:8-oxo-dGTP diphosphatase n=1 Tax=Lactiplantibacillus xiangfangensis TaxID=942150 RepID=A0A0R2MRV8_9LACO|nr:(deoxy)nucleoside triphosphate pyrophosphohydrolase [Lactiplantibacillus xiangfangensis]KRO14955.1 mutator MutT protein [Lactiplantibacillus xiangfangensis]
MKKQIIVVGAVLLENGKILATKRNDDRILGTLWEFPGGKVEKGETPQEALTRELVEEFDDEIMVGTKVGTSVHEYDFGTIHLTAYYAKFITHNFDLVAHSKVEWITQQQLGTLSWAAADEKIAETLKSVDLAKVKFNEIN